MTDKAPLYFDTRLGGLFPASVKAQEAMQFLRTTLESARKIGPQQCYQHRAALTKPSERTARMANSHLPSADELRQLLRYDQETGELFWLARPVSFFASGKQSAAHNCAIWNGKFAGRSALTHRDKKGYRTGRLFYRAVKAHRVIWAIVYGEWPTEDIDHINGDPSDNRISNLRLVSHAENGRNLRLKRNNSTGHCGVYQRQSGRWYARVNIGGRSVNLGTFDTKQEAAIARKDADQRYGFHLNHGTHR